jgi:hypothetical protein
MSIENFTRSRSRVVPVPQGENSVVWGRYQVNTSGDDNNPNWVTFFTLTGPLGYPYASAENTRDQNHGRGPYRVGGPFRSIKIALAGQKEGLKGNGAYYTNSPSSVSGFGFGTVRYVGGFGAAAVPGSAEDVINLAGTNGLLTLNSPLIPNLSTLESTVWDRTKPTFAKGGLGVAIAELRDLPRMLQTSAKGYFRVWNTIANISKYRGVHYKILGKMAPKGAADHFLNTVFGWAPFIKDLNDLCNNVIEVDKRIDRLKFENGHWRRVEKILVNQSDTALVAGDTGSVVYPTNTAYLLSSMTGNPSYEVTRERWSYARSVGRFRQYLPYFDDRSPESEGMLGAIRRQLALHGARISPEVVYKATPWTWLIDWVSDTGHIVSAINDVAYDGLAAKYLYLVHHQISTYTLTQHLPFNNKSGGPKSLQYTRIFDVKQRKEAGDPFSFGLLGRDLSAKQLAILTALGITRK